jgi:hypothetical protein
MPKAVPLTGTSLLGYAARLTTAAALAMDAYIHAKLADHYDAVTANVSQGDLFRTEAALASLVALLVLVWRNPLADAFAWLVAAGGLAALLLYRYVDIGASRRCSSTATSTSARTDRCPTCTNPSGSATSRSVPWPKELRSSQPATS